MLARCIAYLFLLADPPVPDPVTLMKDVQAHQQKMDELRENYTFYRERKVEELDSKGGVKKTTTMEREVFFVNGHQVGRLVRKDGQPLSAGEDKKEQERTRKLTLEFSKKPATFGRGGGVSMISTILGVAEISNPRRMELNRRPTLAFDFKGNPKAESHALQDKGARKLQGTVWIDEGDRQVAKLEVEFYDTFRIGGGLLASVQKGTIIQIEQSPVGEGLWMQTANHEHMNARVVTKNLRENVQVRNFDFKRFNVEAVSK